MFNQINLSSFGINKEIIFDLNRDMNKKFLVAKLQKQYQKEIIYSQLIKIIQISASVEKFESIAGMAMQVLRKLYQVIQFENFSNIKLKDCSLNGISFICCNFKGSSMRNVKLQYSWFLGCCLDNVRWVDIINAEQQVFQCSNSRVKSISLSPHGLWLASGSESKIQLWELSSSKKILQIDLNVREIQEISFLSNSLLISSNNQNIFLHFLLSGKQIKLFSNHETFKNMFNFSYQQLMVAKVNGKDVFFLSISTGKKFRKFIQRNDSFSLNSPAFDCHHLRIAVTHSHQRNIIDIYDFQKGKQIQQIKRNDDDCIKKPIFSPTGCILAFQCENSAKIPQIVIWNVEKKIPQTYLNQVSKQYSGPFFSKDGKIIASYDSDRNIHFHDVETGDNKLVLSCVYGDFVDLMLYPKSQFIFNCCDEKIIILDTLTKQMKKNKQKKKNGFSSAILKNRIVISSNGDKLVFQGVKKNFFLNDLQTGQSIEKKNIFGAILFVLQPQFKIIAFIAKDNPKTIYLYDFESEIVFSQLYTSSEITSLAISYDDRFIACSCKDLKVRIFNVQTLLITSILGGYDQNIIVLLFSPNGQYLATGSQDSNVRVWDLQKSQLIVICSFNAGIYLDESFPLAFSPDSQFITFAYNDEIILWNVITRQEYKKLKGDNSFRQILYFDNNFLMASTWNSFSIWYVHSGNLIQFSNNWRKQIASYSSNSKILVCVNQNKMELYHFSFQKQMKIILNNQASKILMKICTLQKILISLGQDGSLNIFDLNRASLVSSIKQNPSKIRAIAVSESGKYFAYGCQNQKIYLWSSSLLNQFEGEQKEINTIEFSSDECFLASGSSDGQIILWNVLQRIQCKVFYNNLEPINKILFSLDNQIITYSLQSVIFYGEKAKEQFKHFEKILTISISRDNRLLAFSSQDHKVYILNVQNRNIQRQLSFHNDQIRAIAFSQDCEYLITGGDDEIVYLSKVENGQLIDKILNCYGKVTQLTFFSNTLSFIFVNENGNITLVDLTKQKLSPLRFQSNNSKFLYLSGNSVDNAQIISTHGFELASVFHDISDD